MHTGNRRHLAQSAIVRLGVATGVSFTRAGYAVPTSLPHGLAGGQLWSIFRKNHPSSLQRRRKGWKDRPLEPACDRCKAWQKCGHTVVARAGGGNESRVYRTHAASTHDSTIIRHDPVPEKLRVFNTRACIFKEPRIHSALAGILHILRCLSKFERGARGRADASPVCLTAGARTAGNPDHPHTAGPRNRGCAST